MGSKKFCDSSLIDEKFIVIINFERAEIYRRLGTNDCV